MKLLYSRGLYLAGNAGIHLKPPIRMKIKHNINQYHNGFNCYGSI